MALAKKTAKTATAPTEDENTLYNKYRPQSLDRIIGHEAAVTRLRGMIKSGKIPNAIAIFGPTSVGKTTLFRAFAAEINGKPALRQMDYKEINAATQKGLDDMRDLERLARFRPQGKRRFLVIDESQMLLTNAQAVNALLKPLEEPSKRTTWGILSMEPAKFKTTEHGRAILNRCTQIILQPHTEADLKKQALRIIKGEEMTYALDPKREVVDALVQNSGGEMRTLANLVGTLQQYYEGLDKKPKLLKAEHLGDILSSVESTDDALAAQVMIGVYTGQYKQIVRALLDVQDPFMFLKRLQWVSAFMLNNAALGGARHRKIWWSALNKEVHTKTKDAQLTVRSLAMVNAALVRCQTTAGAFQTPATDLLASELYYLVNELTK